MSNQARYNHTTYLTHDLTRDLWRSALDRKRAIVRPMLWVQLMPSCAIATGQAAVVPPRRQVRLMRAVLLRHCWP